MTSLPKFPCEGGCVCGEVRYRLLAEPIELHACHCTDCQSLTGSAFVLSMSVRREALETLQGKPVSFCFETRDDGIARVDWRCPRCGCRLWSEPASFPQILTLRPGTLDDTSWLLPAAHLWTKSAQPWVAIPKDSVQYERQPEDPLDLVRAWRRQLRGSDPDGRGQAARTRTSRSG